MVIRSGININEKDTEGNTPLLSTFIGWDFTQRLAAHLCLVLKADVLVLTENLWTPFTAAARSLDSVLFQELSNGLERSLLHSSSTLQAPDLSIEESKSQAYNTLGIQNEFHHRRVGGAETFENLCHIVDLIVDEGMMDNFKASDVGNGTNRLIGACFMRQDDLVDAVLRAKHCPGLDEVEKNGMSALHWAAQRGRFEPAMKLLSASTNPLLPDNRSLNAFHHSAQFSPKLLEHILGEIEAGRIHSPTNLDVKSILDIETQSHETIFTLLVTQGSAVHLEVAEALRTRYGIDHDTCTISLPLKDTKVTLMGFLIANAVISNLFTLQQIEYVLNSEPRPRFVADTSGATLLHYAVNTFQHGNVTL
jgi:ankyrin repeat protein